MLGVKGGQALRACQFVSWSAGIPQPRSGCGPKMLLSPSYGYGVICWGMVVD
jgi:hypothetical protein